MRSDVSYIQWNLDLTKLPRDWANWFVKSRVPALYRKSRHNEFVEKQQKCSLYQGIVNN